MQDFFDITKHRRQIEIEYVNKIWVDPTLLKTYRNEHLNLPINITT